MVITALGPRVAVRLQVSPLSATSPDPLGLGFRVEGLAFRARLSKSLHENFVDPACTM